MEVSGTGGVAVVVTGMDVVGSGAGFSFSVSDSSSSSSSQPTSSSSRVVAPNIISPYFVREEPNTVPLSNSFRLCSSISSSFLKK